MINKMIGLFQKLFAAFNNQKIKYKILSLYLAIVIISVVSVGSIAFFSMEAQLKQNVYDMTDEVLKQINHNIADKLYQLTEHLVKIKFDAKLEHLINMDSTVIDDQEIAETLIYYKKIFNDIYSFGNNYQLIHSLIIYCDNGLQFHFEQGKYYCTTRKLPEADLRLYFKENVSYHWLNFHHDAVFFPRPGVNVLSLVAPIRNGLGPKALVIANMNVNYIKHLIESTNLVDNGTIFMVSNDGVLASRNFKYWSGLQRMIHNKILHGTAAAGRFEYRFHRQNYWVNYETIQVNGWRLAAVLKKDTLMRDVKRVQYGIFSLTVVIIFLAVGAAIVIAYGVTKPINKLAELMEAAETGNFDIRFKTRYNDEIGQLTRQFNSMLEKMKGLIAEVEREQTQKRIIELRTLQMQINPHFLYNTLDSIKFLAELKSDDTSEMVRALGQFYRHSLSKGDGIVSVREEIDHLQSYLTIQKIRYSTRFDYRIEIADSVLTCKTIKFILQPLVENAIYHGVRKKPRKGLIVVKAFREDGDLLFTVFDNGVGITPERLALIQENLNGDTSPNDSGIGVYNVHKRVVMNYGENYGISIDSVVNEFTTVKVKLPFNPVGLTRE